MAISSKKGTKKSDLDTFIQFAGVIAIILLLVINVVKNGI